MLTHRMNPKTLSRRSARAGFTLLEILFVVALIALLAGVLIGNLGGMFDGGRKDLVKLFVTTSVKAPITSYQIHMGSYPTTEEGLQALITAPGNGSANWRGPYFNPEVKTVPLDPWGSPYQYRSPGVKNPTTYDLWSLGPDKKDGTADDIGNWN